MYCMVLYGTLHYIHIYIQSTKHMIHEHKQETHANTLGQSRDKCFNLFNRGSVQTDTKVVSYRAGLSEVLSIPTNIISLDNSSLAIIFKRSLTKSKVSVVLILVYRVNPSLTILFLAHPHHGPVVVSALQHHSQYTTTVYPSSIH